MNRILSIVGGLMLIVMPFLPFVTALGMTVSMWDGGSPAGKNPCYVIIGAGVIVAIVGLVNKRWLNIVNVLLGLGTAALGAKYYSDAQGMQGIGIYILIAGGALALVGAIMGIAKKKA